MVLNAYGVFVRDGKCGDSYTDVELNEGKTETRNGV